jgi:hypothetical protein
MRFVKVLDLQPESKKRKRSYEEEEEEEEEVDEARDVSAFFDTECRQAEPEEETLEEQITDLLFFYFEC